MTRYAKRKLKYSANENFNLLPYVEWDRFVTLIPLVLHKHKCYNTCFYLHDRFSIRKLFLVRHGTLRILSWWAEPIHIWIWIPNMKNFTINFYYDKRNEGYVIVSAWTPLKTAKTVWIIHIYICIDTCRSN
jgi:hypothetical protein